MALINLKNLRPINYPGDANVPTRRRSWTDWPVLASLVVDLVLLGIYLRPWTDPTVKSVVAMLILLLIWSGPFLGLVLRRGRGAALICYSVMKAIPVASLAGWWWASVMAEQAVDVPRTVTWIAWHGLGVMLALIALVRGNPAGTRGGSLSR